MAVSAVDATSLTHDAWAARRVTLMGLGRHGGGVGAARYLASHGARVTVSDRADEAELAESRHELRGWPIAAWHFGGHDERDFRDAQCVVVNPAVPLDHRCLKLARDAGATVTSEIELFLRACPAHVIGVTGSNGKSTTATMLAEILTAAGRRVWLGGNIGASLLGQLERMTGDDWVVLELSSFQLAHLGDDAPLPEMAVVTNCTPNHLDWHGSFVAYAAAKRRLVRRDGTPAAVSKLRGLSQFFEEKWDRPPLRAVLKPLLAVLNPHDPVTGDWAGGMDGRARASWPLDAVGPLAIPGLHNRQNAALAAAAAEAAGVRDSIIRDCLRTFRGLEHRLQAVAEIASRRFYNDSKATSPAATIAALDAIDEPVWLLAGGVAKAANFNELARRVVHRARGAAVFGAAGKTMQASLLAQRADFDAIACETLADALAWCWRRSDQRDAILLSPACASFDQFRDFEARGNAFCGLVRSLEARVAGHARS